MSEETVNSTTVKIKTANGYEWLFCMRFDTVKEMVENIEKIEETFKKKGWENVAQGKSYPKKEIVYVEGKKCPKCQGRLIEATTKEGKKFHKCENQKYNWKTKTVSGCDHVDWLDQNLSF